MIFAVLSRTIRKLGREIALRRDRSAARKAVRALLDKPGDHLIDDIGVTRQELRNRFGLWER